MVIEIWSRRSRAVLNALKMLENELKTIEKNWYAIKKSESGYNRRFWCWNVDCLDTRETEITEKAKKKK